MERTEAVQLVATTIARYPHVTHLRLMTRGSFSGRSRIEVMTLGQAGVKRPKGTREQEYISFEGDMFARPDDLPVSTWFEVFEALDPSIYFASGCAEQTGFDVDAEGNITNRRGSKTQAIKAERKHQAALARRGAELAAHTDDPNKAQRLARVVRGGFDTSSRPVTMMIDMDSVTADYSAMVNDFLSSSDHAEFKRTLLDHMLSAGTSVPTSTRVAEAF